MKYPYHILYKSRYQIDSGFCFAMRMAGLEPARDNSQTEPKSAAFATFATSAKKNRPKRLSSLKPDTNYTHENYNQQPKRMLLNFRHWFPGNRRIETGNTISHVRDKLLIRISLLSVVFQPIPDCICGDCQNSQKNHFAVNAGTGLFASKS